jgi:hypothetical protein
MRAAVVAIAAARVPFDRRVVTAPDVLCRVIGDEAVILHLGTELYLGLDPVGTRMWTVLQESPSIEAAFEALAAEYEVEPGVLRSDLAEFVDELMAQSLVRLEEPAS